jgi:hypothetical protein
MFGSQIEEKALRIAREKEASRILDISIEAARLKAIEQQQVQHNDISPNQISGCSKEHSFFRSSAGIKMTLLPVECLLCLEHASKREQRISSVHCQILKFPLFEADLQPEKRHVVSTAGTTRDCDSRAATRCCSHHSTAGGTPASKACSRRSSRPGGTQSTELRSTVSPLTPRQNFLLSMCFNRSQWKHMVTCLL